MTNEILTINEPCFNYYKKRVKFNEDISIEQANLKMTRNMQLAYPHKNGNKKKIVYKYGCLHFTVKNGEVNWIKNRRKSPKVWFKDMEKYNELNIQLGIHNN